MSKAIQIETMSPNSSSNPAPPRAEFGAGVRADLWAFDTMRRGPRLQTLQLQSRGSYW